MVAEAFWPRGGWSRAVRYVSHRLNRLPDPPHRIARGIFAGVFTAFTPFYGIHFFIAALMAWIMRGNIVAALLATFFGNPLTYVPIGVIAMETGYWLLGLEFDGENGTIGEKFVGAGRDLWHNFVAIFTPARAEWSELALFYQDVFWPYLIGGIIPGLVCAIAAYYVSLPLITAYQNRRRGMLKRRKDALKAKLAALKKKSTSAPPSAD